MLSSSDGSAGSPRPGDWRPRFIAALNNKGETGWSRRTRGLVVLAGGGDDLSAVQSACYDRAQTYNSCLTARYRVAGPPVLGTVLAAFAGDLLRRSGGQPTVGDLLAPPLRDLWPSFAETAAAGLRDSPTLAPLLAEPLGSGRAPGPSPELDERAVRELLALLGREDLLPVGRRLVLLVEVADGTLPAAEWEAVVALLPHLPERVVLVLPGRAPQGVGLLRDQHVLQVDLSGEAPPAGGPALRYRPAPLTDDAPATQDTLGLADDAEALAKLVLHAQTRPLVIGVHAPWGKGKSTFLRLVDEALVDLAGARAGPSAAVAAAERALRAAEARVADAEAGAVPDGERAAARRRLEGARASLAHERRRAAWPQLVSVQFNAWRYEEVEQVWSGLAERVTRALEQTLPRAGRLRLRVSYAWRRRRAEVLGHLVVPALLVVLGVVAAASLGARWQGGEPDDPLTDLLAALLPAGSLLVGLVFLAGRAWRVAAPVSTRLGELLRRPDYAAGMGYQHRVLEDLEFVMARVRRRHPGARVVVAVDDLDRCSDDRIMDVLRAVHLVLSQTEFFVLLALDSRMVHRAIQRHYRGDGAEPLEPDFPSRYLRKILQLSYHLPPHTDPEARFPFLRALFSQRAVDELADRLGTAQPTGGGGGPATLRVDRGVLVAPQTHRWEDVEDTGVELQAFQDYSVVLEDNPRELKRLVNVHRLMKILHQRKEVPWSESRQRQLVLWLVFCTRWPGLVDPVLALAAEGVAGDCLTALRDSGRLGPEQERELSTLLDIAARAEDSLSAADLGPGGELRLAAYKSQLVTTPEDPPALPRDPAGPQPVAEHVPVPRPADSAGEPAAPAG